VIFPQTLIKEGLNIAERIHKAIEKHVFKTPKGDIKLTVSIGLTYLQNCNIEINEILGKSDSALYQAKSEGCNKVKLYFISNINIPVEF